VGRLPACTRVSVIWGLLLTHPHPPKHASTREGLLLQQESNRRNPWPAYLEEPLMLGGTQGSTARVVGLGRVRARRSRICSRNVSFLIGIFLSAASTCMIVTSCLFLSSRFHFMHLRIWSGVLTLKVPGFEYSSAWSHLYLLFSSLISYFHAHFSCNFLCLTSAWRLSVKAGKITWSLPRIGPAG
jgi:hypothetical protein